MGDDEKIEGMDADEEGGGESKEGSAPAASGGLAASRIVKILVYVIGGILAIFLVIGISYLVSKYVQEKSYQKEQDIVVAPPPPPLQHYDLPTFQTTTSDAESHFVKITMSLGFEDNQELLSELIARTVQIQHTINIILRGKKMEEMNNIEGTITLSEEVKAHVNSTLSAGKIKEVYFKDFVVN
jgi:flagellar basal body-associated protein FliL